MKKEKLLPCLCGTTKRPWVWVARSLGGCEAIVECMSEQCGCRARLVSYPLTRAERERRVRALWNRMMRPEGD